MILVDVIYRVILHKGTLSCALKNKAAIFPKFSTGTRIYSGYFLFPG